MKEKTKVKSRTKSTLLNTGAGVASKVVGLLTGFIMRWAFIYTLGLEYAGVSSLFTDVLNILCFAELGLSGAMCYAMYAPAAKGDKRKMNALLNFYKKAYRLVALTVFTVGLLLIPFLGIIVPAGKIDPAIRDEISSRLVLIYMLYLTNTSVSFLLIYRSVILWSYQEYRYTSYIGIIFFFIRSIGECITLFVFRDFIAYLVVAIVVSISQNIATNQFIKHRYPEECKRSNEKITKEEQKSLMKDVRALMLYKISGAINDGLDTVIISAFLGSYVTGVMGNFTMVIKKVNTVIVQFFESVSASIGNLAVETDADRQYSTFKVLQFITFWLSAFCSVSFFVLLNPFITIWLGAGKTMGMHAVGAMVAGFYLTAVDQNVASFRTSNGLFVQAKAAPVAMTIINIVSSVLLVKMWAANSDNGVFGVKIATVIASMLTVQWFDPYLVFKNIFHKRMSHYYRRFVPQLLLTCALCGCTYAVASLFDGLPEYPSFALKTLTCALLPNAVILAIYFRTPEFRAFMMAVRNLAGRKRSED